MNSDTKQEDSVNEESCEDRISSLEDDVLCHILSFLPTKYVVRTSILSKRWEHVWTSVPVLDFDDELVWPFFPIDDSEYYNDHQVDHSCFPNFVNKVLSVHNLSCVRKFYLHCSAFCYNPEHIKAWIFASLTPNVEVLDFCVTSNVFFDLPQTLYYTCQNLVYLKLRVFNLAVNVSSSVCLPRLKTLMLYPVDFSDDNSIKKLLTGCPVLKSLYVEIAGWKNVHTLNVFSASLERLTIDIHKAFDNFHSFGGRFSLVLEAPNLKHIVLSGCTIENYKISELSYLISASFSYIQNSSVVQFLKHVSNVKELCLTCYPMNYPQDISYDNLPMFLNLTHLKAGISKILPHLIQQSPNLKSLVFEKEYGFEDYDWCTQDYLFECLLPRLETIEIRLFEGCKTEMEIVEYYLKNAMALEMMTFTSSIYLNLEERTRILEKIQMLPRGSNSCQIAFR